MDVDEDDDFYAPAEDVPTGDPQAQMRSHTETKSEDHDEDLEEGEEEDEGEDEGSDSVRSNFGSSRICADQI
jgi:pre-mRNA 3'-end-processing factor FIP1